MANEAILRVRLSDPIDMTCTDGNAIEKGAILWLEDPLTVSGASVTNVGKPFAGIAAREKIASDGRTRISVYRNGIFDCTASGVITAGELVFLSGLNLVSGISRTAASEMSHISGGHVIGVALETASDTEVIQVKLTG
jgi:hypothetical protein